jgi:hypothetical protein
MPEHRGIFLDSGVSRVFRSYPELSVVDRWLDLTVARQYGAAQNECDQELSYSQSFGPRSFRQLSIAARSGDTVFEMPAKQA